MSTLKKRAIACLTASALALSSTASLAAQDVAYTGGNGYSEYRTTPSLAPGLALGAIALAAIIAVAVQNSNNKHAHGN